MPGTTDRRATVVVAGADRWSAQDLVERIERCFAADRHLAHVLLTDTGDILGDPAAVFRELATGSGGAAEVCRLLAALAAFASCRGPRRCHWSPPPAPWWQR